MSRWLRILLKSIVTLGVLVAIVVTVDLSDLWQAVQHARWTGILAALLLLPVNLLLDGWVWSRLLDAVDGTFRPRRIATAVLSGLALGFWTPARVGEYAGRAFSFPNADAWSVSLSVFAQRMVDMAVGVSVGLVFLVGTMLSGSVPSTFSWLAAGGIGLCTGGILTALAIRPNLVHRAAEHWLATYPDLLPRTRFFAQLSGGQRRDVFLGSIARYLVFMGQFVCLAWAIQPSAPLFLLFMAAGLTFYVKYLIPSLTFLDLGIREGGAVFFFQVLGLGAAAGLTAALLLFSINVLLPAAIGVPFVMRLTMPHPDEAKSVSTARASVHPDA